MKKPLVSVLMLTYNHEKFISQSLDSVLEQKTSFPYELVIGDDVSSDRTREILLEYKRKYPTIIRLILNKVNVKPTANFMNVYNHCRGKYIALLEGDDYWTSPLKLQKQVDFMEKNIDCSVSYHATRMIDLNGETIAQLPFPQYRKDRSDLIDLVQNESFMASCSTMFRNKLFGPFPVWFHNLTYIADLPLNILNTLYGRIGYIDEELSVYRWQSSSLAFSAQPSMAVNLEGLKMFIGIYRQIGNKYATILNDKMARNCFYITVELLKKKKIYQAIHFFMLYKHLKKSRKYISILDNILVSSRIYWYKVVLNSKYR